MRKLINIKGILNKINNETVDFNTTTYDSIIEKVNTMDFSQYQDHELTKLVMKIKNEGIESSENLITACALYCEASFRVLGMKPFDVQIIAGLAMFHGKMVEMQTGEGKTLAAVLTAYLYSLKGKGVHILTFNDYLAERDAQWMGSLYEFLETTVSYIKDGLDSQARRKAYNSDVTYLTAREAGFDYLREFLCKDKSELVQRPLYCAIIDEADSILLDEARIPLVLAGDNSNNQNHYEQMATIIDKLNPLTDYSTDNYDRNVFLTDQGIEAVEKLLGITNLYSTGNASILTSVNNALHAKVLLKRDVDYVIKDNKILPIDEFTGRIALKRQWPYGLHEAIEVKEGIKVQKTGQILASISMCNFICLYQHISGMTGTALSSANELFDLYGLRVALIPTNKPCVRVDHPDTVYVKKEAKQNAILEEIRKVHATGRPILIGTASVEESEELNKLIKDAGINSFVLNAKNDHDEAKIIAKAGEYGAVTVSTNMAGRGTDIKLGGVNEENHSQITTLGGLYVLGTNRHESRRVDNQLRGRAGRQGDIGSTKFIISLEDELIDKYKVGTYLAKHFDSKNIKKPISDSKLSKDIEHIQKIIEGQNFDIRKTLNKYSEILDQQRRIIFKMRNDVLLEKVVLNRMRENLPHKYNEILEKVGTEALTFAEKQITLYMINKCWTEYLDYIAYMKDSIHLVNMAGKTPVFEFNKMTVEAFEALLIDIDSEIIKILAEVTITKNGIDMESAGLFYPSSTWTYMLNDDADQIGINPLGFDQIAAAVGFPLWLITILTSRFLKKKL